MQSSPQLSLVQGDSTIADSYTRALDGNLANLLYCDPPYCLLTRRRKDGRLREEKHRKIEHSAVTRFENLREYRQFTERWLSLAVTHLTPDAPIAIWTNPLGKQPITDVANSLGYQHLIGEFVWGKQTKEQGGGEVLLRVFETALIFSKAPSASDLSPAAPALAWSILSYYDDGEAARWGNHTNFKPFAVVEPILRNFSQPGDRILDTFAGSGSIPAAALTLGRSVAGIEITQEWQATARKRCEDLMRR